MLPFWSGFKQENRRTIMNNRTNSPVPTNEPTRRQAFAAVAVVFSGLGLVSTEVCAAAEGELSHAAESIHQEVVFKASRKRVYEALTDAKQFDRVVQLSDAMKTHMPPGAPPAQISPEVGGAFSIFGGIIVGRNIELVPNERIVQAWRPIYWKPGVYSIVKFEVADSGSETKLVLDHNGFPDGDGNDLLEGWNKNYWEPLAKFLA
jgi:activator of HSP90 ATPase